MGQRGDMMVSFEREGTGRYQAMLDEPRARLGLVHGKSGSWYAETPDGKTVSCFNTRADAGKALLNDYRVNQSR